MALENAAPIINMKDHRFDGDERLLQYGLGGTLSSKLASLTLSASVMMSTPPALVTPSPPALVTDPLGKQLAQRDPGFRIEIIRPEDSEKVLEFLKRNFFVDEPLNVAIRLMDDGECMELEEFSVSDLDQGLSVMAVDEKGDVKGVLLGAAVYKDKQEEDVCWSVGCEHRKFKKILRFLYQAEKSCDIFSHYPDLDSLYDVKILSVDGSCRGKGIGGLLTKKGFALARAANLGFLKIDCSSYFSSKIAEKLGCKEDYSIKYSDWKEDGEQVFNTAPPHTHFAIKSTRL